MKAALAAPIQPDVVLTLTHDEAVTLRCLFENVGGTPNDTNYRGTIDKMAYALDALGDFSSEHMRFDGAAYGRDVPQ